MMRGVIALAFLLSCVPTVLTVAFVLQNPLRPSVGTAKRRRVAIRLHQHPTALPSPSNLEKTEAESEDDEDEEEEEEQPEPVRAFVDDEHSEGLVRWFVENGGGLHRSVKVKRRVPVSGEFVPDGKVLMGYRGLFVAGGPVKKGETLVRVPVHLQFRGHLDNQVPEFEEEKMKAAFALFGKDAVMRELKEREEFQRRTGMKPPILEQPSSPSLAAPSPPLEKENEDEEAKRKRREEEDDAMYNLMKLLRTLPPPAWDTRLAVQLLYHKYRAQHDAHAYEFWRPYLSSLPTPVDFQFSMPFFFKKSDLTELQDGLVNKVTHRLWFLQSFYTQNLKKLVTSEEGREKNPYRRFEGQKVDMRALAWAFSVVSSRALRPGGRPHAGVLAPVLDLVNHSNGKANAEMTVERLGRYGDSRLDSFYLADTGALDLKAARDLEEGEEILMSYVPAGNDILMLEYGFVERNNPNDRIRTSLDFRRLSKVLEGLSLPEKESPIASLENMLTQPTAPNADSERIVKEPNPLAGKIGFHQTHPVRRSILAHLSLIPPIEATETEEGGVASPVVEKAQEQLRQDAREQILEDAEKRDKAEKVPVEDPQSQAENEITGERPLEKVRVPGLRQEGLKGVEQMPNPRDQRAEAAKKAAAQVNNHNPFIDLHSYRWSDKRLLVALRALLWPLLLVGSVRPLRAMAELDPLVVAGVGEGRGLDALERAERESRQTESERKIKAETDSAQQTFSSMFEALKELDSLVNKTTIVGFTDAEVEEQAALDASPKPMSMSEVHRLVGPWDELPVAEAMRGLLEDLQESLWVTSLENDEEALASGKMKTGATEWNEPEAVEVTPALRLVIEYRAERKRVLRRMIQRWTDIAEILRRSVEDPETSGIQYSRALIGQLGLMRQQWLRSKIAQREEAEGEGESVDAKGGIQREDSVADRKLKRELDALMKKNSGAQSPEQLRERLSQFAALVESAKEEKLREAEEEEEKREMQEESDAASDSYAETFLG
uniref:SET domain-containing protein n=1 Tax=Chromera velia CCMP2878 TaxID=1169474 RepID=A0A0G4HTL4_9ALVE|eukprot:Cvel_1355.t1-p1 / transcript=Cvel_1355.t1 / gene=Cvel_1355 / organism=Chromera_velia_CCMP2878 / gene_product=hypothetical protein / transcript_product=hypothetical protein / location=Cvel_scaffold46:119649-123491(+) / protein_length=1001 / sequence_SO=supercontig / SO=protein_coding / is_pseudo=false